MTSGDWLPAQAPFDMVRRGYAPDQVTAHLERLEYDLRITTANRDATTQRLNELAAQLAAAQAEADSLRNQLDRTALEPVSMANLSDRMQRMIRLAEEEAGEIRARAEAYADKLRTQQEASLAETTAARAAFDTERERTRKQLAEQVHGLLAEATAEAQETLSAAQQQAERIRQESTAEAQHTIAEANRIAESTVAEASATAATLAAAATAERERLDAESLAHRTQVDEDFDIAMAGRRAEANRVIQEREESSASAANALVAAAAAEAERLVAAANAESQRLVEQATAYSNALVERATMESHQRVADADDAILTLQSLRAQLLDQLSSLAGHLQHIRDLAGSAPELIAPPESEGDRPLSAHFPPDPADRPTPVPLPVPVLAEQSAGEVAGSSSVSAPAGEPAEIDAVPAQVVPDAEEVRPDESIRSDNVPVAAAAQPRTSSSQRTRFRSSRSH